VWIGGDNKALVERATTAWDEFTREQRRLRAELESEETEDEEEEEEEEIDDSDHLEE
jgi:hypothetical protein